MSGAEVVVQELPAFRVGQKVKYKGNVALIAGCWWDERKEWRYLVTISRGKNKGDWSVAERYLEVK